MFSLQLSIILKSDWSIALRSHHYSCLLWHPLHNLKIERLMKRRKLRTQLLFNCSTYAHTRTQQLSRGKHFVSQWTLEGREGKKMRGEMGWDKGIYRVRENWRERGSWQTGGCLLFWKPASYPCMCMRACVCVEGWGGRRQRPSDKNVPSAR